MSESASTATTTSALAVRDLTVSFPIERHRRLLAVDDVGFDLAQGESLGIVGESGCGKTTVARCVVGLQRPDAGSISIDGVDVEATRSRSERRAVQLIFQDPFSSLNPRMTIGAMLTQLLSFHDLARGAKAEERCRELLALVGLPSDALTRYPGAFSGGQRQRIAIARALAVEPRVIVADEPVSALDVSIQATILELFADLRDRLGISLVMISHNLAAVRHVCDRVAVMYLGKLVEVGTTQQVFADPRHPYTRSLLNAVPKCVATRPRTGFVSPVSHRVHSLVLRVVRFTRDVRAPKRAARPTSRRCCRSAMTRRASRRASFETNEWTRRSVHEYRGDAMTSTQYATGRERAALRRHRRPVRAVPPGTGALPPPG